MEENKTPLTPKLPKDEILFGVLSYFNIAVLATIVSKPDSEFCKFHAKQGVALVVLDLGLLVLTAIALMIVPFFAFLLFTIGMIVLFVLHILGIVHALKGEMYNLPVIHGPAKKIDVSHFLATKSQPTAQPVQPEQPVQPVQPTQPVQPVQPTQPVQPVQPVQQPTNSTPPVEQPMDDPIQPTQPVQPAHPANHGQDMVDRAVDELQHEKRSDTHI